MSFDEPTAQGRLDAIAHLGLLERPGDPGLTALTRLAAYVTGAAAAAVHVPDRDAQHRIAATGAPLGEQPRADAMCRLGVDGGFYASVPIELSDGTVVGTLCAWDTEPRVLTDEQTGRLQDLAEQASARIELMQLARALGGAGPHDRLTGLVNRLLLFDRLAQAFARRRRHGGHVMVALVDLDDFKRLNDAYGHEAGDEMLRAVAQRLSLCTRTEDTVARLGGDKFVVAAEVLSGEADPAPLLARIDRALEGSVRIGTADHPVSAAIGVAVAGPGDDPRQTLARADLVMRDEKRRRKGSRFQR